MEPRPRRLVLPDAALIVAETKRRARWNLWSLSNINN
jgi:hypothetical protein